MTGLASIVRITRAHRHTYLFYDDSYLELALLYCFFYIKIGREVTQALAYDVLIPGYSIKNTISKILLWEANSSVEYFNFFKSNEGKYECASQLHSKAQQV